MVNIELWNYRDCWLTIGDGGSSVENNWRKWGKHWGTTGGPLGNYWETFGGPLGAIRGQLG